MGGRRAIPATSLRGLSAGATVPSGQQYTRPPTVEGDDTMTGADDLLAVPAFLTSADVMAVLTGRTPAGQRVGIAFTSPENLAYVMGRDQSWIYLSERALRTMLAPLQIQRIQVDPLFTAPEIFSEPLDSQLTLVGLAAVPD